MDAPQMSIGFGVGDAMTALGLIIVIQQFLKPIYELRLITSNLNVDRICKLIVLGFIFTCLAKLFFLIPFQISGDRDFF